MTKRSEAEKSVKQKTDHVLEAALAALSDKIHLVEKRLISDSQCFVRVNPENIRETAISIKGNLDGVMGETIVGVDLLNKHYELIYYFWSLTKKTLVEVRTSLDGDTPSIDSIWDVFPGLDWHEREVHEMFGIDFKGHPNLSLLLLPDELEGSYPLRKSFQVSRDRLKESGILGPISKPAKQPEPSTEPRATGGSEKPSGSV